VRSRTWAPSSQAQERPEPGLLGAAPAAHGARAAVAAAAHGPGHHIERQAGSFERRHQPAVRAIVGALVPSHAEGGIHRVVVLVEVIADPGGPPLLADGGGQAER
jgi:hypothetical protein